MSSFLTSGPFWSATAERAVKTFAQTAAALIGVNAVGIIDVDWLGVGSGAALATVLSILTSIGSGAATSDGGPSLTNAEVLPDQCAPEPPEYESASAYPELMATQISEARSRDSHLGGRP